MSDLGNLFRLSVATPKPLENFTSTALAIAVNRDNRPMWEALKRVQISGSAHENSWRTVASADPSLRIVAETQKTLWRAPNEPGGYLDLVLSIRRNGDEEHVLWVEVKVDAWEHGDQIDFYLAQAGQRSPAPEVMTLGRTRITEKVPFLTWRAIVDAVGSVSNPHYTWTSLREFLLEERIVLPEIKSAPGDAAACIELFVGINQCVRRHWGDTGHGLGWIEGQLRRALRQQFESRPDAEPLVSAGPILYGLGRHEGLWLWSIRVTTGKNYERIRMDPRQVLQDAAGLPPDWIRYPDRPELLVRTLAPGALAATEDILAWFDEGLQQLQRANVLGGYFAGLAEKRRRAEGRRRPRADGAQVDSTGGTASAEGEEVPDAGKPRE